MFVYLVFIFEVFLNLQDIFYRFFPPKMQKTNKQKKHLHLKCFRIQNQSANQRK